jgi:hypothetical protein
VIGTGEAESSTARIRKITDEEGERELDILPDDLEVAEDVDARRSVDNSAKSEEAEQRTPLELSGDFTNWEQAADDVIGTLPQ